MPVPGREKGRKLEMTEEIFLSISLFAPLLSRVQSTVLIKPLSYSKKHIILLLQILHIINK